MMRTLIAGLGLAALLAGTAIAQDMPPPPGGPGGPPPMPIFPLKRADVPGLVAKHFAMLDVNHDGVLTDADREAMREQRHAAMVAGMKARRAEMFARLDTNGDGMISRQEFDNPIPPGRGPEHGERGPGDRDGPGGPDGPGMRGPMRGHGPMGFGMMGGGRFLEKADANHDGKVTLAEAQAAALKAFDKADVNHDGTLDRDEAMVAMREHRRDRGEGMGGHHGRHGPDDDDDMPPPPPGR